MPQPLLYLYSLNSWSIDILKFSRHFVYWHDVTLLWNFVYKRPCHFSIDTSLCIVTRKCHNPLSTSMRLFYLHGTFSIATLISIPRPWIYRFVQSLGYWYFSIDATLCLSTRHFVYWHYSFSIETTICLLTQLYIIFFCFRMLLFLLCFLTFVYGDEKTHKPWGAPPIWSTVGTMLITPYVPKKDYFWIAVPKKIKKTPFEIVKTSFDIVKSVELPIDQMPYASQTSEIITNPHIPPHLPLQVQPEMKPSHPTGSTSLFRPETVNGFRALFQKSNFTEFSTPMMNSTEDFENNFLGPVFVTKSPIRIFVGGLEALHISDKRLGSHKLLEKGCNGSEGNDKFFGHSKHFVPLK